MGRGGSVPRTGKSESHPTKYARHNDGKERPTSIRGATVRRCSFKLSSHHRAVASSHGTRATRWSGHKAQERPLNWIDIHLVHLPVLPFSKPSRAGPGHPKTKATRHTPHGKTPPATEFQEFTDCFPSMPSISSISSIPNTGVLRMVGANRCERHPLQYDASNHTSPISSQSTSPPLTVHLARYSTHRPFHLLAFHLHSTSTSTSQHTKYSAQHSIEHPLAMMTSICK